MRDARSENLLMNRASGVSEEIIMISLPHWLLNRNCTALKQHANDWQEAVKMAVQLLVDAQAVQWEYYDAIIRNATEHGPYFLPVPGFAMPHAEPGHGVFETCFSLVTLTEPVVFGHEENDPVYVILCVAAANQNELNEAALIQIMNLLEFDEELVLLRSATTIEDIKQLFQQIYQEEDD